MKVLCITKGDKKTPSSNVRVWIVFDLLKEKYNIESDIIHSIAYKFWSFDKKRFRVWKDTLNKVKRNKYDVLFVHKVHFPFDIAILITFVKFWYKLPLIYDIDDPQWVHSRAQDYILTKIANRIFCSSEPFMDRYRKYNDSVIFIPTSLDFEWFNKSKTIYQEKEIIIIGWIGAHTHFKDGNFHIIKPALEELGKRGYKIEFRVIGTRGNKEFESFLKSKHYKANPISFVPYEEVPKNIGKFDIAVAPVVKTEWFEINATGKGVEYMACGVPTVASRVGAYKHLIKDGRNGFLAGNTKEWSDNTEKLINDFNLRERIGKAGAETVKESYSYEVIIPHIKEELKRISNDK